jgi:molybdate transport system substrate-binding protein
MLMLTASVLLLGLASPSLPQSQRVPSTEIMFYAAASLREALEVLGPDCEKETGTRLVYNFGGSNELALQIETADKADLFFSADESWMDRLEKAGLVDVDSRRSPLANRLVVIGKADGTLTIKAPGDLTNPAIRWIALANPDAVPAGKYARAWLQKSGQWDAVKERILPSLDVRAALAAVAAGGAETGVVYSTDARISDRVRVLYQVPEEDGPRISYALAAMRDRPHLEAARSVVAFLTGPRAAGIFERFGFIVHPFPHRPSHGGAR